MKRLSTAIAAILLAFLPPTVAWAGSRLYATGAILNASTNIEVQADSQRLIDADDEGWSLGFGFHVAEHLAMEVTYYDLGRAQGLGICSDPEVLCAALVAPVVADSTALTISIVPHWAVNERFSIYGRLGLTTWDSDFSDMFSNDTPDVINEEEFLFGAGMRFEVVGPLGLFAEAARIADSFTTVSLGATFGF